jgi:hypothetical protein
MAWDIPKSLGCLGNKKETRTACYCIKHIILIIFNIVSYKNIMFWILCWIENCHAVITHKNVTSPKWPRPFGSKVIASQLCCTLLRNKPTSTISLAKFDSAKENACLLDDPVCVITKVRTRLLWPNFLRVPSRHFIKLFLRPQWFPQHRTSCFNHCSRLWGK